MKLARRIILLTAGAALCYAQDQFDSLLSGWVKADEPGVAVMMIRDGRVEYQKGFGLANIERKIPITPQTQFLLASMSKQFTAMGVLILARQGKLSLDDPLSKFFPEFPAYAKQITIRHLLHHTSGLPDYEELLVGQIGDGFFRPSNSPPASREYTARDALAILEKQPKLSFEPGEKFEYSNSGYVVLGQVIEKASGQRYAEFLAQSIFVPLGMKDTMVRDERKQRAPRLALSYKRSGELWQDVSYSPLDSIYGEDNVITTLEDLARWDQALYTDKLVSRATGDEAFTSGRTNSGKDTGYGYGWRISHTAGHRMLTHGGSWAGYRTFIARYPDLHLTFVVLSNRSALPPGLLERFTETVK